MHEQAEHAGISYDSFGRDRYLDTISAIGPPSATSSASTSWRRRSSRATRPAAVELDFAAVECLLHRDGRLQHKQVATHVPRRHVQPVADHLFQRFLFLPAEVARAAVLLDLHHAPDAAGDAERGELPPAQIGVNEVRLDRRGAGGRQVVTDDDVDFGPRQQLGRTDALVAGDDGAVGQDLDGVPEPVLFDTNGERVQFDLRDVAEDGGLERVFSEVGDFPILRGGFLGGHVVGLPFLELEDRGDVKWQGCRVAARRPPRRGGRPIIGRHRAGRCATPRQSFGCRAR